MQFNPCAVIDRSQNRKCWKDDDDDEISKFSNGTFTRLKPPQPVWTLSCWLYLLILSLYLFSCCSPPPEVRRWGNLKETLLRFQRTHDFTATFEALTEGELAGDYFNALGSHRQELLRQHVGSCLRLQMDRGWYCPTTVGLNRPVCCS